MICKLKLSFLFFLITLIVPFAYAETIALEDILASPESFDKREVQVEGEAIGEPLRDDRGVWINISSGSKQIGVFSPDKKIAENITYWGSYKYRGDQLRITGIFYKDCPIYQISDIHLRSLEIIEKGRKNEFSASAQKQQLALGLSIICLITAAIYFIKMKYGKSA